MTDQRPPHLVAGERETLLALLQFQRESVVRKVAGLTEEAAAGSPVASGTSLLWLVRHLTWAELAWFVERFAGQDAGLPPPQDAAPSSPRDAVPAEQQTIAAGTVGEAVDGYRAAWARVDAVLRGADLDAVCRRMPPGRQPVNLRWVLAHMLEETARHAGHADIIRELQDGATGR